MKTLYTITFINGKRLTFYKDTDLKTLVKNILSAESFTDPTNPNKIYFSSQVLSVEVVEE